MFDGFELAHAELAETTLRYRVGGAGTPVVLLHGHPRTHTTWHAVAALLAPHHTVVCPDLRGYGRSSAPPDAPDLRMLLSRRASTASCRMRFSLRRITSGALMSRSFLRRLLRLMTRR